MYPLNGLTIVNRSMVSLFMKTLHFYKNFNQPFCKPHRFLFSEMMSVVPGNLTYRNVNGYRSLPDHSDDMFVIFMLPDEFGLERLCVHN